MKKLLLIALSIAVASCNSNQSSSKTDSVRTDTAGQKPEPAAVNVSTPDETRWNFKTDTDAMTSKERYFAIVAAKNKLEFDSPYDGGSTATVMLRNQNGLNEVMLAIDKGQFVCDSSDGCEINVRFDTSPAIKFTGSGPSDGSSTLLFIKPAKKFINNLKTAKQIIVQAEFYQSGLKTMTFNVDGLKWEH